jgi:AcrR family transcriptional regulator
MRADAARNHGRIVAAAADAFAERGLDASVDDIAARAAVGRATVYRSFPTRDHLVSAIVCERMRWFESLAETAAAQDDAWAAFADVLEQAAEGQMAHRALADSMTAAIDRPEVQAARTAATSALERLMARARAQGAMRADATAREVGVLFSGVARTLTDEERARPEVWRRYVGLIVDAFAAKRPLPTSRDGEG